MLMLKTAPSYTVCILSLNPGGRCHAENGGLDKNASVVVDFYLQHITVEAEVSQACKIYSQCVDFVFNFDCHVYF